MWTTTCHRFPNRAEFLAAWQAAGWAYPPGQDPQPPAGVAVDIVGSIFAPAQFGEGGVLVSGDVIDSLYHVNLAWHGREPDPTFQASLVVPEMPSRGWDVPATQPSQPPVPQFIQAWKGRTVLREAGLLDVVEAAVQAGGGRVQDAWAGASQWDRSSEFLHALAAVLGLEGSQVDQIFRDASAIHS